MLTRSSVDCADRIVATSSSYAFGASARTARRDRARCKSSTTATARAFAPRGRATAEGYPRPRRTETLVRVDPSDFAARRARSRRSTRRRADRRSRRARRRDRRDIEARTADSVGFLIEGRAYVHVARAATRCGRGIGPVARCTRPRDDYDVARRRDRARRAPTAAAASSAGCSAPPPPTRAVRRGRFDRARELFEMRVALPLEEEPKWPPGMTVRTFEPGHDETDWLRVNNIAFAGHPDQGGWTRQRSRARMAEPWFDPSLFLLAVDADGLAGFNWLKRHNARRARSRAGRDLRDRRRSPYPGHRARACPRRRGPGLAPRPGRRHRHALRRRRQRGALGLYRSIGFEIHRTDRTYATSVEPAGRR